MAGLKKRRIKEEKEKMDTEEERRGEEDKVFFQLNAVLIIDMMRDVDTSPETGVLVDEILHSIFFLGWLRDPGFDPQTFLRDVKKLDKLKERHPRPFTHFSLQLPRRSPFSCVLDMYVLLVGPEKENEIKESLKVFYSQLRDGRKKKPLASTTICISQSTKPPDSDRYYGVSMSTTGCNPGQLMVAASCLSSWDSYVAGAVMTYYPKDIKDSFDGTIKLPEHVRCQTFRLSDGREMPPCGACGDLFGFQTDKEAAKWAYGNCAEAESVSNLFKNVETVREEAQPTSEQCTEEKRQVAEREIQKNIIRLLKLEGKAELAKQLESAKIQFSDLFCDPVTRGDD